MENSHLDYLLSKPSESSNPEEDLLINQPDGTKACLNWELRGKGFHMVDQSRDMKEIKNYEGMGDNELLKDAYKELQKRENDYNISNPL